MSFAIVIYNQRMELYPVGGDPILEQTGEIPVIAVCDSGYSIDLSKNILHAQAGEILLFSQPSFLDNLH
jgi:hypothetical protein